MVIIKIKSIGNNTTDSVQEGLSGPKCLWEWVSKVDASLPGLLKMMITLYSIFLKNVPAIDQNSLDLQIRNFIKMFKSNSYVAR